MTGSGLGDQREGTRRLEEFELVFAGGLGGEK